MSNSTDRHWETAKQELADAAAKAGIDPEIMAKIAGLESQYDPRARPVASHKRADLNTVTQFDGVKAMSSAYGYGQFTDATWASMVRQHGEKYGVANASQLTNAEANSAGLRDDSILQAGMLAEFTKRNIDKGTQLGGSNPVATVYALHNLGESAGPTFLTALKTNPNDRVDTVLSNTVIERNPGLYGDGSLTIEQVYQLMGQQMDRYAQYAKDIQSVTPNFSIGVQAAPAIHTLTQTEAARVTQLRASSEIAMREGTYGERVRDLQTQLNALGYHNVHGHPLSTDGFFGPQTRAAVAAFQRDHHLPSDGIVGPLTQHQLNTQSQLQATRSNVSTFADPEHPQHAMYGKLKELLPPGTSEARLMQATATCYMAGIDSPSNLAKIYGNGDSLFFESHALASPIAEMRYRDTPTVPQTMQQVQVYDQQCAQSLAQFQAQQQQITAQVQSGPVLGGPAAQ